MNEIYLIIKNKNKKATSACSLKCVALFCLTALLFSSLLWRIYSWLSIIWCITAPSGME